MVIPFGKGNLILLSLLLGVLGALTTTEAMTVEFTNSMNQNVILICGFAGSPSYFGSHTLGQLESYSFSVASHGLRYSCTFASEGKGSTFLEVFDGWGENGNEPCHCLGDVCPWSISDAGFSCNHGRFSRHWGAWA